MMIVEYFV